MKKLYTRAILDRSENEDSRTISGCAIVFDRPSRFIGYTEYIRKSAITQELIDNSDIIFNYNHQDDKMLARWTRGSGTLNVELRDDGVYFSFEAPDTELGNEVLWHIRHGNLFDCSFAFTLADTENSMRWFRNEDNELCGEVLAIDGLYDMTVCSLGAYGDTSISARDFDIEAIKRSLDEDEAPKQELEERLEEPECIKKPEDSYYTEKLQKFLNGLKM